MGIKPSISDNLRYGDLKGEEKYREYERDKLLYEQNENLKKANEMEKKRQENDRNNAIIQANAIRRAAEIDRMTKLEIEANKLEHQKMLQIQQQQFEIEQRKIRLCDDLKVNYDDLKSFENYLRIGDAELVNQIQDLDGEINDTENQINLLKNNIPSLEKINNEYEKKFQDINTNIKAIRADKGSLGSAYRIIINSIIFLIALFFIFTYGFSSAVNIIIIFVIFNILWKIEVIIWQNGKIKKLKRELKELENEKQSQINNFNKNESLIIEEYNNTLKDFTIKLETLKEHRKELDMKNKKIQVEEYNKFIDFRLFHYNSDMEMLFRKIELNFILIMDSEFEKTNNSNLEEMIKKYRYSRGL